jgi:hypothetical protein
MALGVDTGDGDDAGGDRGQAGDETDEGAHGDAPSKVGSA